MNPSTNLHVIFGSGPLGLALARQLILQEKQVRIINRRGRFADIPAGAEVVAGDAYSIDFARAVTTGAEVVYQCAQPAYHQWVEKFPTLQTSILEGVAASGAKLVVCENLYMYGEVNGPIHEALPYNAVTRKGKVRAAMSEQVMAYHHSGKVRAVIARGSDFFGPNVLESSLGERAIQPILQGKTASMVGSLDILHTYTYIEDFAKAMILLGEKENALGQAWHVPNQPALSQRALIGMFFEQAGLPVRVSGMGRLMMTLGGLFVTGARETVEMMYEFEKPFVVDSSKFTRSFGDLSTPYSVSIAETLAWYQNHANQKSSDDQASAGFASRMRA